MKSTAKNTGIALALALALGLASCKNNDSQHRQDDTEVLTTTDSTEVPTAFKDTVVTKPDSLKELQKAKGEVPVQKQ